MSSRDSDRLALLLLFMPFAIWITVLIVIPEGGILYLSLRQKLGLHKYAYGLANYIEFMHEPIYGSSLLRTAVTSILVTALTLVVGFPIAYYIAKIARGRSRAGLFLMCLIPLWVSDLVRVFGWMVLLRQSGVVSTLLQWLGITSQPIELLYSNTTLVVGLVYTMSLFMIVPLVSILDSMDDSLIEAGYNLGGNAMTVFRRIVLPYSMPGVVAGCVIVFMLTTGSYLIPIFLGSKDNMWFTEVIYDQFIVRYNWEVGSTFGVLLLVFTSIAVWLGLRLTGQRLGSTIGQEG